MEDILKDIVSKDGVTQCACVSSNIDFIRYEESTQTLQVEFKKGKKYNYTGVPVEVWNEAAEAPSIGAFVNTKIKGKFEAKPTNTNLFTKIELT